MRCVTSCWAWLPVAGCLEMPMSAGIGISLGLATTGAARGVPRGQTGHSHGTKEEMHA